MTSTISPQTALVYVMVTMAAVDASISDAELKKIGNVTAALPAFRDFSQEKLVPTAQRVMPRIAVEMPNSAWMMSAIAHMK